MDIVKTLLGDQAPALLGQLQQLGFSSDKAQNLLSETVQQVASVAQEPGAENAEEAGMATLGNAGSLLEKLDISGLASKLDMDSGTVENALKMIMPSLVSALSQGGGLAQLTQHAKGGLLGAAKSALGSLFGGRPS